MICHATEGKFIERLHMLGGDGSAMVREMFLKGEYRGHARLMAVLTLEPGCSVGKHTHHGDEELIYILQGSCRYDDNGTVCRLSPGDAALTRDGESHEIVNDTDRSVEYLAVVLTY